MKKYFFPGLFLFLLLSQVLVAQTKRIAHKSHSGSDAAFSNAGHDDFGNPPPRADTLIWINDSTVVQVDRWYRSRDTIVNHHYFQDPKVSLDSLKKIYPRTVFVGFENKKAPGKKEKNVKRNSACINRGVSDEPGNTTGLLVLILVAGTAVAAWTWKSERSKLKSQRS
ncbi:MAG: hypothetical protein FD123_4255 [Bacteroidetes bacterium]|nr:MAG: hypothetical protein FD123_4255 [Bacteroidota bacterium]